MKQAMYIQIGETALRDPVTREFLPSEPLYVLAEEGEEKADEALVQDIGKILALKFRAYKDGYRKAGIAVG